MRELLGGITSLPAPLDRNEAVSETIPPTTIPPAQSAQSTQDRNPKQSTLRSTPKSTPQLTPPPGQLGLTGQHPPSTVADSVAPDSAVGPHSLSRSRSSTWNGTERRLAPPPSLIPTSTGVLVKAEEDRNESIYSLGKHRRRTTSDGHVPNPGVSLSSLSTEVTSASYVPPPSTPNYATAPTRSVGPKRVFDRATFDLPIANQRNLSIISSVNKTPGERIASGRGSRPLVLNPFSRGTKFENIAALNSLGG